jgi:hypothetical protein
MSEFSDFKLYVTEDAKAKGHRPGRWHWAPMHDHDSAGNLINVPAHESICEDCSGRLHLYWDREALMWLADGDLIVCSCSESGF